MIHQFFKPRMSVKQSPVVFVSFSLHLQCSEFGYCKNNRIFCVRKKTFSTECNSYWDSYSPHSIMEHAFFFQSSLSPISECARLKEYNWIYCTTLRLCDQDEIQCNCYVISSEYCIVKSYISFFI